MSIVQLLKRGVTQLLRICWVLEEDSPVALLTPFAAVAFINSLGSSVWSFFSYQSLHNNVVDINRFLLCNPDLDGHV